MDLLLVNGMVIDGTGAPARRADVGIRDGRITAIGSNLGSAKRTIDAEGAFVTPGFIDIHTHYDGQATWDEELLPSLAHGVTTAVLGSCGVGFAPVRPRDRERVIALMEGVEDIPGAALHEGIRWRWETFPQFIDALDAMPHTMNLAVQVTHDPLRVWVMGERALAKEQATEDDIEQMRAVVREALEAGAVGFSTGRTDNHRDARGRETPAADASANELIGIARAFEGRDRGVLQAVSDFDLARGPEGFDREMDVLLAMARTAKRPLSTSLLERIEASDQWRRILARLEKAKAEGLDVRAQVAPRAIGVILGLDATFHPFIGFPTYKAVSQLPLAERVAELAKPEARARILGEKSERVAGDGSSIPPLVDQLLANIDFVAMKLFRLGKTPSYEPKKEESLFAEAMRSGRPVLEVVYDALLEDEGNALLYFPIYNYGPTSLATTAEMLKHPLALMGLGDGGAHVGTICDASFPTFLLSTWARDKALFSIEEAVRRLTSEPATWMGFAQRGTVSEGAFADLNVIDLASLGLGKPRLVRDLPAGGKRFLQDASGYRCTIVGGTVVRENGSTTTARPGRVLRST